MSIFSGCSDYRNRFLLTGQHAVLAKLLEDESLMIPNTDRYLRDQTISFFGVPALYSIKLEPGRPKHVYRAVFEPGSRNMHIAEQVHHCLTLLDRVAQALAWTDDAVSMVNKAIRVFFPPEAEAVHDWDGGMWMGFDAGDDPPMVKLYVSLRNGAVMQRWQKVADLFGAFSGPEMEPMLRKVMEHAAAIGNTVGFCFAFDASGLRGVRLYSDMTYPDHDKIRALGQAFFPDDHEEVYTFCSRFTERFGSFGRQSVTVGFDFAADGQGVLIPKLLRIKLELSSCLFSHDEQEALPLWLQEEGRRLGLAEMDFIDSIQEARECLGDIFFQYVSVGIQENPHLTVYFEKIQDGQLLLYKLRRAALRIEKFLCGFFEEHGAWTDFKLPPGESDAWVTAYTGLCLAERIDSTSMQPILESAAHFLAGKFKQDQGWGYNETLMSDCDSTAYAALFLGALGIDNGYSALVERFQHTDGGFATYNNSPGVGWNMPQPDVTAMAMRALAAKDPNGEAVQKAKVYLDQWPGLVPSYWWESPYYATLKKWDAYHAAQADFHNDEVLRELMNSPYPTTPFDLSLYLELLCKVSGPTPAVQQASENLLQMESDGKFPAHAILRITRQDIIRADNAQGAMAVEENGIFTAATALHALDIAIRCLEKREYEPYA